MEGVPPLADNGGMLIELVIYTLPWVIIALLFAWGWNRRH